MFSVYPILLQWSWECVLHLIIIIKSELWIINHCLGLGHETMVGSYYFLIAYTDADLLPIGLLWEQIKYIYKYSIADIQIKFQVICHRWDIFFAWLTAWLKIWCSKYWRSQVDTETQRIFMIIILSSLMVVEIVITTTYRATVKTLDFQWISWKLLI